MRHNRIATLVRRVEGRNPPAFLARHWRTKRELRRLLIAAVALGCGETPNAPNHIGPIDPTQVVARVSCSGDTRSRQISCTSSETGSVATSQSRQGQSAAVADLIVGGQNVFVTLTSSNVTYTGDVFSFNATVTNLIPQSLGTTNGTTVDPTGVRVFFQDAPVATGGAGTIDFVNPVGGGSLVDGFATFTATNQAYYQYNQIIAPTLTSGSKNWRIHIPASVTSFAFSVYVSAPVRFPTGWIDVAPTTASLKSPATQPLTATVRDEVGRTIAGQTVTWATNNAAVATVDPSTGVVTAVADGAATITATSTTRTGTAAITVSTTAAATTTIAGAPSSLQVGSASTITVQAKNAAGVNMTMGGDVVVLNASAGTLGAVTDNNNGTYTATLNSTLATTISITGTINGSVIGHPGSVIFTAGAVNSIAINAGDAQTANSGVPVATAPSAIVKDASNNPIQGVTVTFSVTGGGGSATVTSATTNASGIATVGSWTLGAGGVGCAASSIGSCSRNALHAVATGGPNPAVDFKAYIPPIVPTATFQAVGNATLPVAVGNGVLLSAISINGNGVNGTGATLTVTTPSPAGSSGGTATIAANGGFSYLSSPTFVSVGAATESFTFTVSDAIAATTTNAALQVNVPEHVWYVQPGYGGTSTGSDVQPFKDFSATAGQGVQVAAGASDTILVLSGAGVAAGGTLKNSQFVFGQGASASKTFTTGSAGTYRNGATSITLLTPASTPSIGALALASTNALRGVTLTGTGGTSALTGTGFGTLTVSETFVTTATQALNLTTGTLSGSFLSITSAGGTNNVLLSGVSTSGTFALGSGALLGATGDAFKVSGGAGVFTYSGTIANTATLAVNISSATGGSVALSGNINTTASPGAGIAILTNTGGTFTLSGAQIGISSGAATGVAVTGNSAAATVNFAPTAMQITTTSGTGLLASGAGSLSIAGTNSINAATGQAVSLSGVTVNAPGIAFGTTTSGGGTNNVSLASVAGSGSISLGNGALSGASGTAFAISGTNVNPVSYAGTITKTSAGQLVTITAHSTGAIDFSNSLSCTSSCGSASGAIAVTSNTSGTIQFTGGTKTITTAGGGSVGVNLSSNGGAIVNFANGGLAISTTSGSGMSATTSGNVSVSGANNTISSSTGTALTVSSVTITATGLTFKSISANGGANGIVLSSTGVSGGLTVTGDGVSNGSGGTIQNAAGADFATAGNGVYLSSTRNVSLSWMALSNHANSGIFGTAVRNVFIDHVRITGTIGNKPAAGAPRESPIHFEDVGGPVKVQNSRLDGSAHDGFLLDNTTGTAPTVDSLVLVNDTVSTMQGSLADVYANTGLQVIMADGTADIRMRNNSVTFWWGNAIHVLVSGTATATARITGNIANQTSGALAGAGGIWVSGGNLAYNISNNSVQGTNGTAISADKGAFPANMNGTIDNNTVGTSGVSNSGSGTGIGIFASHIGGSVTTVKISNNVIRQIAGSANGAITTLTGDDVGGGGSGTMSATIVGNDIQESGTPTNGAQHGILVTNGRVTNDNDQGCYDIGGAGALANSITNFNTPTGGGAVNRIRVNERFLTTARFPGYTGANNDNAALGAYLLARNTASNFANANNVGVGGSGFLNTTPPGSACTQPSM
ncbi:MAG: invasin domain 3-containing protein [bacterium]